VPGIYRTGNEFWLMESFTDSNIRSEIKGMGLHYNSTIIDGKIVNMASITDILQVLHQHFK
jgi:hypothetical protein